MASKRVITCEHCGQRLSVPADRGALKIRCTKCHAQWQWSPPGESMEMVDLPFRCACTGERFQVAFGRHHPIHRFRVMRVIFERNPEKSITVVSPKRSLSLVSRLLAPFRPSKTSPSAAAAQSFNANEFDFGGWYCPGCAHAQHKEVETRFVQCGTCKEFVCGGRILRVNGGAQTFECHDGCTGGGQLSGEHIEKFDGAPVEVSPISRPTQALPKAPGAPALPKKTQKPRDPPLLGR